MQSLPLSQDKLQRSANKGEGVTAKGFAFLAALLSKMTGGIYIICDVQLDLTHLNSRGMISTASHKYCLPSESTHNGVTTLAYKGDEMDECEEPQIPAEGSSFPENSPPLIWPFQAVWYSCATPEMRSVLNLLRTARLLISPSHLILCGLLSK